MKEAGADDLVASIQSAGEAIAAMLGGVRDHASGEPHAVVA